MSDLSSETIVKKLEELPKNPGIKKKIDKSKLLEVSHWNDEDIKAIEDAGKELNKWRPAD